MASLLRLTREVLLSVYQEAKIFGLRIKSATFHGA